jgi:acetyl esterase/lipase
VHILLLLVPNTEYTQLDVYYPPTITTTTVSTGTKPPILIFHYGGGFTVGNRIIPYQDLVYRNLGAFFAARGILTVIPDYRVVQYNNAKYPEPAIDSVDALKWVVENLRESGDTERIVYMGHSAGAAIIATVLLHEPRLDSPELQPRIKGAVLVGGMYHHEADDELELSSEFAVTKYYGSLDQLKQHVPIALLKRADGDLLATLPKLLMVVSENDEELIVVAHEDFAELAQGRLGVDRVEKSVAKGHNHISLNWSPCCGEGEEWAEDVANWVKEVTNWS